MRFATPLLVASLVTGAASAAEVGPPPRELRVDRYGDPLPEGAVARLGTLRQRHPQADRITFAPDGKSFVTTGPDGRVCAWEAATGRPLFQRRLPGPPDLGKWVSPDGRRAAVLTAAALEIWDLDRNRRTRSLPLGNAPTFSAVAFAPDGDHVATADQTPREHRVRVWDLRDGGNRVLGAFEGLVTQLLYSGDGARLIAASSEDGFVMSWDPAKEREVWREHFVHPQVSVGRDGRRVLVASREGNGPRRARVQVYAETEKGATVAANLPGGGFGAALAPDGKTAALVSRGRLSLRDVASGVELRNLVARPQAVAFSPDGSTIAAVLPGGLVRAFDAATGRALLPDGRDAGHTTEVSRIVWSPDGTRLASTGLTPDFDVRVWAADGALLRVLRHHGGAPTRCDFLPGGGRLLIADDAAAVELWDLAAAEEPTIFDFEGKPPHTFEAVVNVRTAGDGRRARLLLAGTLNGQEQAFLATLDLKTGKLADVAAVALPEDAVPWAALHRSFLSAAGRVFDAAGRELPQLEVTLIEEDSGRQVISADGRVIALARRVRLPSLRNDQGGMEVIVFERATGRRMAALPFDDVGPFDLSADGRRLVLSDRRGLHVYDLISGKEVLSREAPDGPRALGFASAVAFAHDGRHLATGHADTTILIWEVPPPAAAPLAAADLERLWTDLAAGEAGKGLAAAWTFAARPDEALPFLRERLLPVRPQPEAELKELIADLDAKAFRTRTAAARRLAEAGDAAAPALRAALAAGPPAETRGRLERLLAALDPARPPHGADLRAVRALAALEHTGVPEARQLLKDLAGGLPSARLTREAKQALERLGK
jgi:WD40 repeat protein